VEKPLLLTPSEATNRTDDKVRGKQIGVETQSEQGKKDRKSVQKSRNANPMLSSQEPQSAPPSKSSGVEGGQHGWGPKNSGLRIVPQLAQNERTKKKTRYRGAMGASRLLTERANETMKNSMAEKTDYRVKPLAKKLKGCQT